MDQWTLVETKELDEELIRLLFDNRIAAIRVPGFLSEGITRAVARAIQEQGFDYYEQVNPPIGRIGITQYEHRHESGRREKYFAQAAGATRRRRKLFQDGGDLLHLVLQQIGRAWSWPVGVARDTYGREYFAGLVRIIDEALLHCDWAPHDAPGWSIGSIDAQLTWNIYCSTPERGGATVVYNRPWTEDAEQFLIEGTYGYESQVVAGVSSLHIEPREADLILFNSRNFHRVEAGSGMGDRISVSSFIGRTTNSDLVAWS
ncbi:hypothetical protein ACGFIR_14705 [Micromonospora sp. NPDC049051]|uniref:2OG-Fe(II)-dependent halogenase WelO5 family protein n=1 Tax=Micromonospora sp. NPDC049051 TaxID=3364264 RepID=UPI003720AEC7